MVVKFYTDEELCDIVVEIYVELYRASTPSNDFRKMMKSGEVKENGFYMNYYLDDGTQEKIIAEVCKKYKLSDIDKKRITTEIFMGCSPTSHRRNEK